LSLVLLDIDDFKRVNDSLGHSAGDEALRQFAALLKSKLRPDDTSSRFGGEEFVLLLPGAPVDGAAEMVRRLQRTVAEQAMLGGPNRLQITFSGGVTQVVDGNLSQALELADDALYEAKRTGKNRVCCRPAQAA
jgi:diguanylate cyclase